MRQRTKAGATGTAGMVLAVPILGTKSMWVGGLIGITIIALPACRINCACNRKQ